MMRRCAAGGLMLVLGGFVWGGCTGTVPVSGSLEEATVKGVVRVRGKPVADGRVTFRTSNVNRPQAKTQEAVIGKDGSYSITTLVGENFVEVSSKATLSYKDRDLIENEQMIKIEPGQTTLDIDIPPKPRAAP